MDRGNTKQEILAASLRLFSVQGFEATSISQIANVVGIRKASLYSHFESKQAILDALVREIWSSMGTTLFHQDGLGSGRYPGHQRRNGFTDDSGAASLYPP